MRYQGHRLRTGRHTEAGRPYLITSVTDGRQPALRNFDCGVEVSRVLEHYRTREWCASWAWVVMPDHVHWLVSPCGGVSLSKLMEAFKALSARRVNRVLGRTGRRLWQPGYHDHALRQAEDLRVMARYVIANPVRAGLVRSVRDYPFWDASWL